MARARAILSALALAYRRDWTAFQSLAGNNFFLITAFLLRTAGIFVYLIMGLVVLFLDEPFEAIDPVTAKIMRDLLQSVARHGVTVFLTSHILSMVERIAHQIVMIRKGTKVWDSPVTELPQSLEDHYFDLVETPVVEELEWLGPVRS